MRCKESVKKGFIKDTGIHVFMTARKLGRTSKRLPHQYSVDSPFEQ